MKFNNFELSEATMIGINKKGFEEATEIQEKSIPLAIDGHDIIAQSQTGTGKTCAFSVPMLERIDANVRAVQGLVLCPTRELAVQVGEAITELAAGIPHLKVGVVYGGEAIFHQIKQIKRGAHIVVGTPGRMLDHLNRKTFKLDQVKTVVLDEADEMLKMGFKEELEGILDFVPQERQTLLFSATMPKHVELLAERYTVDAKRIRITRKEVTNSNITQEFFLVKNMFKREALNRLYQMYMPEQALVFCNTKKSVDETMDALLKLGIPCDKIHGDIEQSKRLKTIERFNRGSLKVLIATDVAARGLDIDGVDAVFNYEVPNHPESYVHRIGRTGRAGREGKSFTLVSRGEVNDMENVMRYTKVKIDPKKVPGLKELNREKIKRFTEQLKDAVDMNVTHHARGVVEYLVNEGHTAEDLAATLIDMHMNLQEEKADQDISFSYYPNSPNKSGGSNGNGKVNLVINLGRNDDKSVKDLLGLIHSKAGVRKHDIGEIKMHNHETQMEMSSGVAGKIIKALDGAPLGQKKIQVKRKSGGIGGNRRRNDGRKFSGNSRSGEGRRGSYQRRSGGNRSPRQS